MHAASGSPCRIPPTRRHGPSGNSHTPSCRIHTCWPCRQRWGQTPVSRGPANYRFSTCKIQVKDCGVNICREKHLGYWRCMCLLIELAAEMTRKKYITMPAYRTLATMLLILAGALASAGLQAEDRKSTRLNSSH